MIACTLKRASRMMKSLVFTESDSWIIEQSGRESGDIS